MISPRWTRDRVIQFAPRASATRSGTDLPNSADDTKARHDPLAAARVPYGFTLTVWATAAANGAHHGFPDPLQSVEFVAAATAAFLTASALGRRRALDAAVGVGLLLQVTALAGAVAVGILSARLSAEVSWLASSLAATSVYFGVIVGGKR